MRKYTREILADPDPRIIIPFVVVTLFAFVSLFAFIVLRKNYPPTQADVNDIKNETYVSGATVYEYFEKYTDNNHVTLTAVLPNGVKLENVTRKQLKEMKTSSSMWYINPTDVYLAKAVPNDNGTIVEFSTQPREQGN